MKWPWAKKPLPEIPPFKIDFKAPQVKDPAYVVEEAEMTKTGMFRIFPWLKERDEPKE